MTKKIKTDAVFWLILPATGLDFLNSKLGYRVQCFKIFFMMSYPVSIIYFQTNYMCLLPEKRYKEFIAHSILEVHSPLLWYLAYSRKKITSKLITEVYRYHDRYATPKKFIHNSIVYFLIILLFLHCLIVVLFWVCNAIRNNWCENLDFWFWNSE